VTYGLGVLNTSVRYRLHHWGLLRYRLLDASGTGRLRPNPTAEAAA
jgi:hypothetical protein